MPLPSIEPSARVGDQVFEAIRAAIMSGQFAEGYRLRIRDLAAELGTSVMPVREAIRRLEELGLAEAVPYRGAVVRGFTPEELLNVYSVRRLLEIEAAARGATLFPDARIPALEAELQAMRDTLAEHRVVDYLDHDEEFLGLIYSAAGNPVLLENIRVLWSRCRAYKIVGAKDELDNGRSARLLSAQARLLQAVVAHDPQRAARITEDSLDAAMKRIRRALPEAPAQN